MDKERVKFERKHMKLYNEIKTSVHAITVQLDHISVNLDESAAHENVIVPPKVNFLHYFQI